MKKKSQKKQENNDFQGDMERNAKELFSNEQKSLLNMSIVEIMLSTQKNHMEYYSSTLDFKKINFISACEKRIDKEDKILYIAAEIQKTREYVESDMLNYVYDQFTQPLNKLLRLLKGYKNNLGIMMSTIESEDLQECITTVFSDSKIELNDISNFVLQIEKNGEKSALLRSAIKSKDMESALINAMFFIHYENKYLDFLKITLEELNQPTENMQRDTELEKIEWMGTQKELGELFVELHKKGWIKEINSNLIERYFTSSATIKQVLKPTKDKTGSTFDGIYTKSYKPKFASVRPKTQ